MAGPVTIGIIGCGSVMHGEYMPLIEALARRAACRVVMAADPDETARRAARERWGITHLTADYQEVLRSPEVELVLILTPVPLHGPITRAALAAGKHVLVEKPLALSLDEAQAIVTRAQHGPGYLVCAPHIILSKTYQAMWQHIAQGTIGRPLSARAFSGTSGPDWAAWFYRHGGGGALFDLGVYALTSLTGLLGPARRVSAWAGVAIPERTIGGKRITVEAEDNVHVTLDFGAAVYATLTTGFTIQESRAAGIEVYGSTGTIQMIGADWAPSGYDLWQSSSGAWQSYRDLDEDWSYMDGLRHLVACIRRGVPPLIRPDQAYHVLEIMLKAREAAGDGQARVIASTFAPLALPER